MIDNNYVRIELKLKDIFFNVLKKIIIIKLYKNKNLTFYINFKKNRF